MRGGLFSLYWRFFVAGKSRSGTVTLIMKRLLVIRAFDKAFKVDSTVSTLELCLNPRYNDTSSRFLLNSLGWDNLSFRRAKRKVNLMYECINNLAPAYLCNLFAPRTPNYYFRNAKKKLMLPKPRTDYLKRSFSYSGALLWNNLPEEIRTSNSLGFFKRSSHRWFSDQYSHTANM